LGRGNAEQRAAPVALKIRLDRAEISLDESNN